MENEGLCFTDRSMDELSKKHPLVYSGIVFIAGVIEGRDPRFNKIADVNNTRDGVLHRGVLYTSASIAASLAVRGFRSWRERRI